MNLEEQFGVTDEQIREAAALLRRGELVAFPTETVYGLGANALDPSAVEQIFVAKGRPHTSPLIVHVSAVEMARELASEWPERADALTRQFWPGPLTLVVRKQAIIPDVVTAGLPTVGLRMPAHPVALALLREAGVPLAAPSANRFTQLSPTTAEHVRYGLGERVAYILDGGACEVGIESTVLSIAEDVPALLRPGGVLRSDIEAVIGPVTVRATSGQGAHESPGMHPQHYSPKTRLVLVYAGALPQGGRGVYLQIHHAPIHKADVVKMPSNPRAYAALLYATLHSLDKRGYDWIAAENPDETPEWEGVLDRLRRASARQAAV